MLKFEEIASAPRPRLVSLLGSAAVHICVLLVLYQVGTVVPHLLHHSSTRLYQPSLNPPPAKAGPVKPSAPPPSPVISQLPVGLLVTLPTSPRIADLPAPPELPVARSTALTALVPTPSSPVSAVPAPPPPAFATASAAIASTAPLAAQQTGVFGSVPTAFAVFPAKQQVPTGTFGPVPIETAHHSVPKGFDAQSGFGSSGVVASNARRELPAGGSSGFDRAGAAAPVEPSHPVTKPTAFSSATVANPAHPRAEASKVAAEALEILFKPRPAYTEEDPRRTRKESLRPRSP